jgi:hypothetical protein
VRTSKTASFSRKAVPHRIPHKISEFGILPQRRSQIQAARTWAKSTADAAEEQGIPVFDRNIAPGTVKNRQEKNDLKQKSGNDRIESPQQSRNEQEESKMKQQKG